jgi:hypothetical protein
MLFTFVLFRKVFEEWGECRDGEQSNLLHPKGIPGLIKARQRHATYFKVYFHAYEIIF